MPTRDETSSFSQLLRPEGSSDPPYPLAALDAEGRVAVEAPCVGCGYLLRGLWPHDACPECGEAIEPSLRADLLRFGDPDRLSRLRRGAGVLIAAFVLGIAWPFVSGVAPLLGLMLLLVAVLLMAIGSLMVSAPLMPGLEKWPAAGLIAAGSMPVLGVLGVLIVSILADLWNWSGPGSGFVIFFAVTVSAGMYVSPYLAMLELFHVLRSRARRLSDPPLVRRTAWLYRAWMVATVLVGLTIAISVVAAFGVSVSAPPAAPITPPQGTPATIQPTPTPPPAAANAAHTEQLPDGTVHRFYPPNDPLNPYPGSHTVIEHRPSGVTVETARTDHPDGSRTVTQTTDDGQTLTRITEDTDPTGQAVSTSTSTVASPALAMGTPFGWGFAVLALLGVALMLVSLVLMIASIVVLVSFRQSVARCLASIHAAAREAALPGAAEGIGP